MNERMTRNACVAVLMCNVTLAVVLLPVRVRCEAPVPSVVYLHHPPPLRLSKPPVSPLVSVCSSLLHPPTPINEAYPQHWQSEEREIQREFLYHTT